jgi:hypothetical protein
LRKDQQSESKSFLLRKTRKRKSAGKLLFILVCISLFSSLIQSSTPSPTPAIAHTIISTSGRIGDSSSDSHDSNDISQIARVSAWIDGYDSGGGYDVFYTQYDVFNSISPCWYQIADDPPHGISPRSECPKFKDQSFLDFCELSDIKVYATIGMGPNDRGKTVKAMGEYRSQHIQTIVDEVVSMGYAGIDLNYEGLLYEDRELQNAYIRDLASALHAADKELIVTLAGKDSDRGTWGAPASQDYGEIGMHADYVRVMCYGATQSLPVSQVRSWIEYTVARINRQKVALANPFFDSGSTYTSQMCDLVLEYDLHGLCAWTLSYDQSEPGDFDVIRSKFLSQ